MSIHIKQIFDCCTTLVAPLLHPLSQPLLRHSSLVLPLVMHPYHAMTPYSRPLSRTLSCCALWLIFELPLHAFFLLFFHSACAILRASLKAMEALGTASVCIGDGVEANKRALGTRKVVGPGLVLQPASQHDRA